MFLIAKIYVKVFEYASLTSILSFLCVFSARNCVGVFFFNRGHCIVRRARIVNPIRNGFASTRCFSAFFRMDLYKKAM